MITEIDVPYVLEEELPEIENEVKKIDENITKVLQYYATYTKHCAEAANVNKLISCFMIADKFLRKGNHDVKSAVENVYVYSISSLLENSSPMQQLVKKMLPVKLKHACLKHIADLSAHNDWKDENCLFLNETIQIRNRFYPEL